MKMIKLVTLFVIAGSLLAQTAMAGEPLKVGTGLSGSADAEEAGRVAATAAKTQLGETPPKAVIVFAGRKQLTPELLKGVGSVFKAGMIYGCEGYGPLTSQGNLDAKKDADGVAVLAVGGDISVATVNEKVAGKEPQDFVACGEAIGRKLEALNDPKLPGKVILTFGNQHVGDNAHYVKGLTSVLGHDIMLVGAAAGDGEAKEIVAGNIVQGENVCVLIQGDFTVKSAVETGQGKDGLIASAGKAMTSAFQADQKPLLVFIFDCGGRRGDLLANEVLDDEHAVMKKVAGEVPLFGFYGGGEIGTPNGKAPVGVGYHIATCVIHAD
jgi:hypothetical protein